MIIAKNCQRLIENDPVFVTLCNCLQCMQVRNYHSLIGIYKFLQYM